MRALIACFKFDPNKVFVIQMLPDGTRTEVARAWQWIYGAIRVGLLLVSSWALVYVILLFDSKIGRMLLTLLFMLVFSIIDRIIGYFIYRKKQAPMS